MICSCVRFSCVCGPPKSPVNMILFMCKWAVMRCELTAGVGSCWFCVFVCGFGFFVCVCVCLLRIRCVHMNISRSSTCDPRVLHCTCSYA